METFYDAENTGIVEPPQKTLHNYGGSQKTLHNYTRSKKLYITIISSTGACDLARLGLVEPRTEFVRKKNTFRSIIDRLGLTRIKKHVIIWYNF